MTHNNILSVVAQVGSVEGRGVWRSYPYFCGVERLFLINPPLKKNKFSEECKALNNNYNENIKDGKVPTLNDKDNKCIRNNTSEKVY